MSATAAALACVMLFQANIGAPNFHVLAKTDGTPSGTAIVKDLDGRDRDGYPVHYLTSLGQEAIFLAGRSRYGWELYRSDGTTAGTRLVQDYIRGEGSALEIYSPPFEQDNITILKGVAYFSGLDSEVVGDRGGLLKYEPRKNKNRVRNVARRNLAPDGTSMSYPPSIIGASGDTLVLSAALGNFPSIVSWNHRTGVSQEIIAPGSGYGATGFADMGRGQSLMQFEHFFWGDGHLIKSDGTWDGTETIYKGLSRVSEFTRSFKGVMFAAATENYGNELWFSDGSKNGTARIKDINTGRASSNPAYLTKMGPHIYFSAENQRYGRELWRTDGTSKGTQISLDLNKGENSSDPRELTVFGRFLMFTANDTWNYSRPLYRFDPRNGTARRISSDDGNVRAWKLIPFGSRLLFAGSVGQKHGLFIMSRPNAQPVLLFESSGTRNFEYFATAGDCQ